MKDISIGTTAGYALLGYGVVFLGLVLLLIVVTVLGRIMVSRKRTAPAPSAPEQPDLAPDPQAARAALPQAAGTGGQILLNNVPEREAALVMAVVAFRLKKPLNRLRFKSIREVNNDEV